MQKVDISLNSYLKLILVAAAVWVVFAIRDILILLFVVFILVQALQPTIDWLKKTGVPKALGVLLVYLVLFAFVAALISLVIPPLVEQLGILASSFPTLLERVQPLYRALIGDPNLDFQAALATAAEQLGNLTGNLIAVASNIFGGLFAAFTVLVLSFYLLVDQRQMSELFHMVTPRALRPALDRVTKKLGQRMGGWLRGQVVISAILGAITYLLLLIIGLPYALTVAVVTAVFEIVPVIGPILSAIFALVIALTTGSWAMVIVVLVLYVILQQLENQILVPKVMEKAVGLSPVVIIVALLIGGTIAGVAGAILAIPVAAGIDVLMESWTELKLAADKQTKA